MQLQNVVVHHKVLEAQLKADPTLALRMNEIEALLKTAKWSFGKW
jgi:hypothetical protein